MGSKIDGLGQCNLQVPLIEVRLYSKLTIGSIRYNGCGENLSSDTSFGDEGLLIMALQMLWNIVDNAVTRGKPAHYGMEVAYEWR